MATAGVKRQIAKNHLRHEDFKSVLQQQSNYITMELQQTTIRSFKHKLFAVQQEKVALSAVDDKRFICSDSVTTRAYGHFLTDLEQNDNDEFDF